MIKCLFLGHKWKHVATHIGERISFNWFAKKTFIDHTLEDTEYLDEKPIEE